MSMLSLQIDELRQVADGQATYRDARAVILRAADTIWELRDDLQRANAENAKLRELVRDALMPRLLYGIYRCPDEDMPIGDAIEWADSELRSRAEELGVELEMEV